MRIDHWTRMTSQELWQAWLMQFPSPLQAEAAAIFACNRLVKEAARDTKQRFYAVKDAWLQRVRSCCIEGYRVRGERRYCYACNPLGIDPDTTDWHASEEDWCDRCDGSGIWSERTLYLHVLDIEGIRYSFHSYTQPPVMSEEPGEDKETFGGQFTEAEWEALALPCSGLVRMLRWVIMALWHDQGRPVSLPTPQEPWACHCRAWPDRPAGAHHPLCRKRMVRQEEVS